LFTDFNARFIFFCYFRAFSLGQQIPPLLRVDFAGRNVSVPKLYLNIVLNCAFKAFIAEKAIFYRLTPLIVVLMQEMMFVGVRNRQHEFFGKVSFAFSVFLIFSSFFWQREA
jgi:hypothetical protein